MHIPQIVTYAEEETYEHEEETDEHDANEQPSKEEVLDK